MTETTNDDDPTDGRWKREVLILHAQLATLQEYRDSTIATYQQAITAAEECAKQAEDKVLKDHNAAEALAVAEKALRYYFTDGDDPKSCRRVFDAALTRIAAIKATGEG